jgi:TonB-linked SusC/RagA family outer membrane protein
MPKLYLLLFFLFFTNRIFAQMTAVGSVTNERGHALSGAVILIKSTTVSTSTDQEGKFSLNLPGRNSMLVVSALGYASREIETGGIRSLYIRLLPENEVLIEEVEVAYGRQNKRWVTGSVVAVRGSDLARSPAINLTIALAGRLPGLTVINPGGEPGNDGATLLVRGINTLADNSPLLMVDGIPDRFGGIDRINALDIESISVLKDAAAAMYGSANGVILITTRRGQIGKPSLTYSFNQGFQNPTVIPKLADAAQYTSMLNELDIYNGLPSSEWEAAHRAYQTTGTYLRPNGSTRQAPFSPDDLAKYRDDSDPWGHPNTDWFGATLRKNAPQVRHTIQLNGGTTNFRYLASLGYLNQDANYRNSATGYRQYDLRINLDGDINKYVRFSLSMLGRQEARRNATKSSATIFRMMMRGKPQQPAFWPNGLPGPDLENGENPVVIATNQAGYDQDTRNFLQTSGLLEFKIPGIDGLKLTATAAIDYFGQNTKRWEIPLTLYFRGDGFEPDGITPKLTPVQRGPEDPRLSLGTAEQVNITPRAVISYDKTVVGEHRLNILAGTERYQIERNFFTAYRRYFLSTALDQLFAGGDQAKDNSGGSLTTARNGYFGRVGYGYKEKYLAEWQGRYDGTDVLPGGRRYRFFYGLMLGWIISEEMFWKKAFPAITFFKIRGSAGKLGSDQPALMPSSDIGQYQTSIASQSPESLYLPSPTYNLGMEGLLFSNKLTIEFDVFSKPRTRILSYVRGPRLPEEKLTELANRGWEFSLAYRNRIKDFSYGLGINGAYTRNKLLSQEDLFGTLIEQSVIGKPVNAYAVYRHDGTFKNQAEIDANGLNYSALVNQLRPGDMRYKDVNRDGKITPDDRIRLNATNLPVFQGGVTLEARYRGFDLNLLLQGSAGAKQWISAGESGSIGNYLLDVYQNRWSIDNPGGAHPRIANRNDQYYSTGNDYWLRSTDYIRLKNLELGYSIPIPILTTWSMSHLRLYISGFNLLTLDKLKVFDPETSNALGYYYPQQKVVNVGLKVRF